MADIKILTVDDSPTMRRIVVNTLKQLGYNNIVEAQNGRDALEKLDGVNLVITDWNMPEMDGLALVKAIRSKPEHKDLKIIMVTTEACKEDIVEAIKAGVNNYVIKPFTADTFQKKIEQVLAK